MNKKINIEIAVGIILLFAIVIGGLVYFEGKNETAGITPVVKQPQLQNQQHAQQDQVKAQTTPANNPLDNIKISSFDNWKTYSNKNIGIEIKYPPELYSSDSKGKITFDYLSPTDPAQSEEGSVLFHFNISSQQKTVEQYISENNLSTLQNFKQEQIQLANATADKITYTDAFAGGNMYIILIQNGSNLIVIDYAGSNGLEATFNKMLSTVNKI